MPRLRRRALGLSAGAVLLFAVGTNVEAGWLVVLAALLLGAVIAGIVLPPLLVRGVRVERRAPAEAFQGDEVTVELLVSNVARGVKLSVVVADPHLQPVRVFVPVLRPGERIRLSTRRLAARRGVQEATRVEVSSAAPFGTAESRRSSPAEGRTVVYPRLVSIGPPRVLEASTRDAGSSLHFARRGDGHDYLGIREYRVGDSMRHVHWPSTARTGTLMVREFEQERRASLAIVVDTWADRGRVETPLDRCCSIAASVADAARSGGHPVALAAAVGGQAEVIGGQDRIGVLEWLAALRGGGGVALPEMLRTLSGRLEGFDAVLLALPSWSTNEPDELAGAAEALGAPLTLAAIVDAESFPRGRRSAPVLEAADLARLQGELEQRGIAVERIVAKEDVAVCLDRLLSRAA